MRRIAALAVAGLLAVGAYKVIGKRPNPEVSHDATTVFRDNHQQNPTAIDCPTDVPVLLIIGQSNAANYGETRGISRAANFYQGRCYQARDPLLGASGDRGSIWTRMPFKGVIAPIAIGSSRMEEWAPGGRLFPRIQLTILQLREAGMPPTHALILQGASDARRGTDPKAYLKNARNLVAYLKARGVKVYMGKASGCGDTKHEGIRQAQAQSGAIPGPDLDRVRRRINGCHLRGRDIRRLAEQWSRVLIAPPALPPPST